LCRIRPLRASVRVNAWHQLMWALARAAARAASEIALPVLAPVPGAKGDRDRNVGAGRRKADDERHQPRKQSAAALDHRDAVRAALAIEIVHGAQRLRQ
jgi:hypothetical protein